MIQNQCNAVAGPEVRGYVAVLPGIIVMTISTKLRAQVSPQAISKVTRIFNGTLDDIFNELFQNARRAGAMRSFVAGI